MMDFTQIFFCCVCLLEWKLNGKVTQKNTPKMKERKKTLSEKCEFALHFIRASKRASVVDAMVGISQTRTHMWALTN